MTGQTGGRGPSTMSPLNPAEVRVLGSLIEKDITTPDYYPLTLNALTNACNQSSNRDPVMSLSDHDVVRGLDSLREKKLAFMFEGADSRVSKYGHRFAETFELAAGETRLASRARRGRARVADRKVAGAPGPQASPAAGLQGAALRAPSCRNRVDPGARGRADS